MGIPRRYSTSSSALVGTDKTIVTVISASTRAGIWQVIIGNGSTNPFDYNGVFYGQRVTAAGTAGGAITPAKFDSGDAAASATSGGGAATNFSVEPTYTANEIPILLAGNLRDQLIFFAGPGYEVITPATAANGLGVKSSTHGGSAVSAVCHATIYFLE